MPLLEVRRHAPTKKDAGRGFGSALSAEGVALARRIGAAMGPFDRVIASTIPRTLETAIAMGFSVDECHEALGKLTNAFWADVPRHGHWEWASPLDEYRRRMTSGGAIFDLAQQQLTVWAAALKSVPSKGAVLVISHGHVMEAGLVAAIPDEAFGSDERPFAHCEGFRLQYTGDRFSGVQWLRRLDNA